MFLCALFVLFGFWGVRFGELCCWKHVVGKLSRCLRSALFGHDINPPEVPSEGRPGQFFVGASVGFSALNAISTGMSLGRTVCCVVAP